MRPYSEQFQDLGIIGRGSFGLVRKVRNKNDGKIYVRKEISYKSMNNKEIRQLASEFKILRELHHSNIVQYFNHEDNERQQLLYIYMEYCDGGDLSELIKKYKEKDEYIPETLIWQIFTQSLLALYRCHYGVEIEPVTSLLSSTPEIQPLNVDNLHVIIHRDIKPDNIFFMSDNYTVKLGDFGLAKCLSSETEFAKTYVGTPYYMPPEVISDRPYNPVCDVWSLGCVMYELCSLKPPFVAKTHLQLQEKIKNTKFTDIPPHYSNRLKICISACLIKDPSERADVNQLLQETSFKIYRKEWELNQKEIELNITENELKKKDILIGRKEIELLNYEKKLLKFDRELDEHKKEMNIQNEETRLKLRREFEYVLEKNLNYILSDLPPDIKLMLKNKTKENRAPIIQSPQMNYNEQNQISMKLKGPRSLQDHDKNIRYKR